MIRPVSIAERTESDILESRFFTTSIKKHKKKIKRGGYADDNPLMTAGFVLFVIVVFMFLLMSNIVSAKSVSLEDDIKASSSEQPQILKTKHDSSEKSPEEDIKNIEETDLEHNRINNLQITDESLMFIETRAVEATRFQNPHRTDVPIYEQESNFNKRIEMTSQ